MKNDVRIEVIRLRLGKKAEKKKGGGGKQILVDNEGFPPKVVGSGGLKRARCRDTREVPGVTHGGGRGGKEGMREGKEGTPESIRSRVVRKKENRGDKEWGKMGGGRD